MLPFLPANPGHCGLGSGDLSRQTLAPGLLDCFSASPSLVPPFLSTIRNISDEAVIPLVF